MFKICDINAGKLIEGLDFPIYGVSDIEMPESNSIIFVKKEITEACVNVKESIFVTKEDLEMKLDSSSYQIRSKNHKELYGILLGKLRAEMPEYDYELIDGSYISTNASIGENVKIAPFCIIESDVVIGNDCKIGAGTIIHAHTKIGNNVEIKEHCMIATEDADLYRNEQGHCRVLPHLAGTIIEDGCLVLANAYIGAGDTRTTVIKKNSLISAGAKIGHNNLIEEGVIISAGSDICGHCNIGANTYVAPEAVVKNRLNVGENAYIGLGASVISDVGIGDRVFGNPARKVPERK